MSATNKHPVVVPTLRFPEFADQWNSARFGDISTVIRGSSPRPKGDPKYYGPGVPRLMVEDVARDGKFVNPTTDSLTPEGAKLSRPCKKGTLTIVCSGTAKTVGQASFLETDACIHDGFLAMVDIDKAFLPDFVFYQIQKFQAQSERMATHGGTFINLTTGILKDYSRNFPTLPEQRKVADFLTAVDGRIQQLSQKKALLHDYKKGVMQQLFTQTLRFKDDHGNVFPDWEDKKIGDVAELISGQHLDPDQYDDSGVGVPYFTGPSDFTSDPSKFTKWTKSNSKVAPPESVLITVKGNGVGRMMYSTLPEVALGRQLMAIRSESFSNVLLYQFLLTKSQQFVALASGNLIPGLSRPDILSLAIPAPCLAEQTKIANFLAALDRKIEIVAQQIELTQTFKRGLLQQMFV